MHISNLLALGVLSLSSPSLSVPFSDGSSPNHDIQTSSRDAQTDKKPPTNPPPSKQQPDVVEVVEETVHLKVVEKEPLEAPSNSTSSSNSSNSSNSTSSASSTRSNTKPGAVSRRINRNRFKGKQDKVPQKPKTDSEDSSSDEAGNLGRRGNGKPDTDHDSNTDSDDTSGSENPGKIRRRSKDTDNYTDTNSDDTSSDDLGKFGSGYGRKRSLTPRGKKGGKGKKGGSSSSSSSSSSSHHHKNKKGQNATTNGVQKRQEGGQVINVQIDRGYEPDGYMDWQISEGVLPPLPPTIVQIPIVPPVTVTVPAPPPSSSPPAPTVTVEYIKRGDAADAADAATFFEYKRDMMTRAEMKKRKKLLLLQEQEQQQEQEQEQQMAGQ